MEEKRFPKDQGSRGALGAVARWLVVIVLLVAVLACGFGLLASREPGVHIGWRIGYAAGALLAFAAAVVVARRASRG